MFTLFVVSLLKKTGVLWGWRLLLNKKKASKEHHVNYYLNNDWRFSVLHYYVNKETTLLCSLLLPSHSQIHTNILYNTQSEKLGLTYKCAPESVCLQINIWVYISKHGPSVLLIAHIMSFFVWLPAKYTPLLHNVCSCCVVKGSQHRTIYHAEYLHTLVSYQGALNAW